MQFGLFTINVQNYSVVSVVKNLLCSGDRFVSLVKLIESRSCSWSSTPDDVSTKELVWDDPAAWLVRLGIPLPGPVDVIDSDITALTAAADKVIKVGGSEPFLVNLEFQSSHKSDLVETLWFRQAALFHRHKVPVRPFCFCCAVRPILRA